MTREEAIKVLSSYDVNGVWADVDGKPYNAEEQAEAFDMAIEALEKEPKHGKWIEDDTIQHKYFKCSNCGIGQFNWGEDNYCRNCGAKMDKEVEP